MKLSRKGLVKRRDVLDAVYNAMKTGYRQVVVFCTPRKGVLERVKVTYLALAHEWRINIGRPNYREREWLKRCKKAGCLPRRFYYPGTTGRVK